MNNILKFNKFKVLESSNTDHLGWVKYSKDNRPGPDSEITENAKLIKMSVQLFDNYFGTDYFNKFGTDYHSLVGSNIYYVKEVINALIDETLDSGMYIRYNYTGKLSENQKFLYDHLMTSILNDEDANTEYVLDFISKKIPNKVYKNELLYKFFNEFGNEFSNDLIKEIFDDNKNGYTLGGDGKVMNISIQRVFLSNMKKLMDKYNDKYKNKQTMISVRMFFSVVLDAFYKSEFTNTDLIKEQYTRKRLNDWLSEIKKSQI